VNYIPAIWQTDKNVNLKNLPVLGNCLFYEKVFLAEVKTNELERKE
jgi:hypothetical protein